MTSVLPRSVRAATERRATPRHYVMCPPTYFDVTYTINPWMDPTVPVDKERAMAQWSALRDTYLQLGHRVDLLEPLPGLPDMVFAANGATVVGGRVLGARFRHPQRAAEAEAHLAWFRAAGFTVVEAEYVNEGEGDLLVVGDVVLAGSGFRTDPAAHREASIVLGRPVISLELVDPRFYHLDTAIAVLDDTTIAWLPAAFSPASQEIVRRSYPDAIEASPADAEVLGLNAVSDGRHVVLPAAATGLAEQIAERGFVPVPVDLSELLKAGGGAKCCTLEVRA
ncbi:N-Dimethylarginine dimethylaminohydrolase [Pseudonocardia thermophila]|uniref:N-Dimethylarginine dimethylaminohydrolase n=2 Tax=Pseudonocardia thermophila TaxID=1848 RepID=A0A1M6N658_PSETH|nr:N-Dimethylarginine dimethylaminohydrolase [Pseudonocardia thermophila]